MREWAKLLRLDRAHGGNGGEDGVAVVGAAAAVQLAVAQYRRPRTQPFFPSHHGRLFVEMAVHQHGRGGIAVDLHEEEGRAAVELAGLDAKTRNGLLLDPGAG